MVCCDVVYVCCFVVCGCSVSRRYIDVCYCDMFSVVNVYLDHFKFCVVCINVLMCVLRYVCCGECYVVSNECVASSRASYTTSMPLPRTLRWIV